MMIRTRVWAFRLTLAVSTVAALPVLDLVKPAAAASKKASVALGPIAGRKSKDVRDWVMDALRKDYEVTDAEEVVPKKGDDEAYAKSAAALGADWVVTGVIEDDELVLTIRDGADGSVWETVDVAGAGAKLKRAVAKDLPSSFAEATAVEEEEEEEEAAADDAETSSSDDAADGDPEAADDEAGDDEGAANATGSPLPRLVVTGGLEGTRRDFTYKDQLSDHFDSAGQLSDYHLPLQPGAFVELELYPLAFLTDGFAANVGLTFDYHYSLTTKSSYVEGGATQEFENLQTQWAVGTRIRFPFESAEVGAVVQYGVHEFFLQGDEDRPIVPDVDYAYVKFGADAAVDLGKVTLGARLGVRLLSSLGELESLWFPGATGSALDAGLFGHYALGDSLGIVLGVDYVRYGFDFNAIPADNAVAAGGAIDQYLIGSLGLRFAMGGGASASGGAASVEAEAELEADEEAADEEAADEEAADEEAADEEAE